MTRKTQIKVFEVTGDGKTEAEMNRFLARPDVVVEKVLTAAGGAGSRHTTNVYHYVTICYHLEQSE